MAQQPQFDKVKQKVWEYLQGHSVYPLKTFDDVRRFLYQHDTFPGYELSDSMKITLREMVSPYVEDSPGVTKDELDTATKVQVTSAIRVFNLLCEADGYPQFRVAMPRTDQQRKRFLFIALNKPNSDTFLNDSMRQIGLLNVDMADVDDGDVPPREAFRLLPRPRPAKARPGARTPAKKATRPVKRVPIISPVDEDEIQLLEPASVVINPMCMICGKVLKDSVVYHGCRHNSYFDRSCYIQTNPNNLVKSCPFPGCSSKYNYTQLIRIDLDLAAGLEALKQAKPHKGPVPVIHELD